ncbi:MAG: hypothetical protein KatS3mg028_0664 [Bacteroidia bacterium]|nr:MAG: hypothetical protein KatS3mg028_0664 [Bacteroidia bacterium]
MVVNIPLIGCSFQIAKRLYTFILTENQEYYSVNCLLNSILNFLLCEGLIFFCDVFGKNIAPFIERIKKVAINC